MKLFVAVCLNVVTMGLLLADMDGVQVSASTYEETATWCKDGTCAPAHTIDGDITDASSWRADGSGAWIMYDLGTVKLVELVKMVFMKGSTRSYFISIDVSVDGSTWSPVGARDTSAMAAGWETFDFKDVNARFVRITGYGNTNPSFPTWININEVDISVSDPSTGMLDREQRSDEYEMTGMLYDLNGRHVRSSSGTGIYLYVAGGRGGACLYKLMQLGAFFIE